MKTAKERLRDAYPDGLAAPGGGGVDYSVGLEVLADVIDDIRRKVGFEFSELEERVDRAATLSLLSEEIVDLEDRIDEVREVAEQTGGGSDVSARLDEMAEELEALKEGEYDYDAIAGLTGRLEERIVENTERLDGADDARGRLEDSLVDKARSIERLSQENEELDERLRSVRTEQRRLADSHNELASLVENLESRIDAESGDLGPIGSELGRLSRAQGKLTSLVQELESRVEDLEVGTDIQDEDRAELFERVELLEKRVGDVEDAQEDAADAGGDATGDPSGSAVRMKPPPSVPRWHDHPPEPGVYIWADEEGGEALVRRIVAPAAIKSRHSDHFYGPVLESGTPLETLV